MIGIEMIEHPDPQETLALLKQHYRRDDWPPDEWDAADFLHCFGSIHGALLYATLFVPRLIEVEGCVFLKELGPQPPGGTASLAQRVKDARAGPPETLRALMNSFNWIEVPYLFSNRTGSEDGDTTLAAIIADAWRSRLRDQYPGRCFKVRVISSEETGGTTGVGFVEEQQQVCLDPVR